MDLDPIVFPLDQELELPSPLEAAMEVLADISQGARWVKPNC